MYLLALFLLSTMATITSSDFTPPLKAMPIQSAYKSPSSLTTHHVPHGDLVTPSSSSPSPSAAPFLLLSSSSSSEEVVGIIFLVQPDDVVAFRDKPVVMNCQIAISSSSTFSSSSSMSSPLSDALNRNVTWLKDGVFINYDNRRVKLTNGSLYFPNSNAQRLTKSDEAGYQCMVAIANLGSIVSRVAHLWTSYLEKTVVEEPRPSLLYPGDSALLVCKVDALPPASIEWLKDDRKIENAAGRGFLIHSDGVLEISDVRSFHFGRYKCRTFNEEKIKTSRSITLSQDTDLVSYLGAPPRFFYRPRDTEAPLGGDLLLHCGVNGRDRNGGRPFVVWLKNGVLIDTKDDRIKIIGRSSLSTSKLRHEDSAFYTCRASNAEDVIEMTTFVTVSTPPTFTQTLWPGIYDSQSDIDLRCDVTGNPIPSLVWMRNGKHVRENPSLPGAAIIINEFNSDGVKSHLRLLGSLPSDSGIYQCLATSRLGSVQTAAMVTVVKRTKTGGMDIHHENTSTTNSPHFHVIATWIGARNIVLSFKNLRDDEELMEYVVVWKEAVLHRTRSIRTSGNTTTLDYVQPSTNYSILVIGLTNNTKDVISTEALHVVTKSEPKLEPAVENLVATPLFSTSILLTWRQSSLTPLTLTYRAEDLTLNFTEVQVTLLAGVTNFRVDNLRPFCYYRFIVEAIKDVADGGAAKKEPVETVCRTYPDVPSSAPRNISIKVIEPSDILLSWEAPLEPNGLLTGYKVKYRSKVSKNLIVTLTTDSEHKQLQLTGVNKDLEYMFRVQALSINGSGPYSNWISSKMLHSSSDETVVPGKPSSLHVRPLSNSIVVSWMPPVEQDVLIRGYMLGYGVGVPDVFRQFVDAKHRHHTIKNLKPSSEYVISLKAFNGAGEGEPIYETTVTREENAPEPQLPLIPPVGLKAVVLGSTSVHLSWSDTALNHRTSGKSSGERLNVDGGRLYTVRYNQKSSKKYKLLNTTQLSTRIEDLRPDTEYEFNVKVRVRSNRVSTWSLSVFNRTSEAAPSSTPRDLTPLVMEGRPSAVILNWQPPKMSNGQVTGYLVYYTIDVSLAEKDWAVEGVMGERLTATIRGLSPETTYYFKAQARNNAGDGPLSPTVIFRTPKNNGVGGGIIETPQTDIDQYPSNKNSKGKTNFGLPQSKHHRKKITTVLPPQAADDVPTWLFWLAVIGLGVFMLASILLLVAVLRCKRLAVIKSRNRNIKSKLPIEPNDNKTTHSLLLAPSTLHIPLSSQSRSEPPDVCRNHDNLELDPVQKKSKEDTKESNEIGQKVTNQIAESFYYFPSKTSGSFKSKSKIYNPGRFRPSLDHNNHHQGNLPNRAIPNQYQEISNAHETRNTCGADQYMSSPYVIPVDHKLAFSGTISRLTTADNNTDIIKDGNGLKRLSMVHSIHAPRVNAGDATEAKRTRSVIVTTAELAVITTPAPAANSAATSTTAAKTPKLILSRDSLMTKSGQHEDSTLPIRMTECEMVESRTAA